METYPEQDQMTAQTDAPEDDPEFGMPLCMLLRSRLTFRFRSTQQHLPTPPFRKHSIFSFHPPSSVPTQHKTRSTKDDITSNDQQDHNPPRGTRRLFQSTHHADARKPGTVRGIAWRMRDVGGYQADGGSCRTRGPGAQDAERFGSRRDASDGYHGSAACAFARRCSGAGKDELGIGRGEQGTLASRV